MNASRWKKRKASAEAEKHKLMDAYYAGAIDVDMLKSEQNRIGAELRVIGEQLERIDDAGKEWLDLLEKAMTFAVECGRAYRQASERGRRMLNQVVVKTINIRDGKIAEVAYHAPFDLLFSAAEFEYVRRVETMVSDFMTSAIDVARHLQVFSSGWSAWKRHCIWFRLI